MKGKTHGRPLSPTVLQGTGIWIWSVKINCPVSMTRKKVLEYGSRGARKHISKGARESSIEQN